VDQSNKWSSTIIIPDGDKFLYISPAAMAKSSVTPVHATKQPFDIPVGSIGLPLDPDLYGEHSWLKLKGMITKVGYVRRCRLMMCCANQRITNQMKAC
jgi:hypothetical protein